LSGFRRDTNWYNPATGDFRRILKAIGYEYSYYYYGDEKKLEFLGGKNISQKDYEMLQSYILYKLGLEAKGGFVSAAQFEKVVPEVLKKLMRRAIALKPLDIPVRMKIGQIANLAGA
ncbi:MAG: hypothetical protein J6W09_03825, partial [Bacteroidales bacterium]|nr:hypothetical protein [Bacteroidales bacterium]